MTWVQSFMVAILAVATVIYTGRAVTARRSGNPQWGRWALVAGLFAVALALNLVALAVSG